MSITFELYPEQVERLVKVAERFADIETKRVITEGLLFHNLNDFSKLLQSKILEYIAIELNKDSKDIIL